MACAGGMARHSVGGAGGAGTVCDSIYVYLVLTREGEEEMEWTRAAGLSEEGRSPASGHRSVSDRIGVLVDPG